jgi:hypothetical protein
VNLGLGDHLPDNVSKERCCGCQIESDHFHASPSPTKGGDTPPYASQAAMPIQHSEWDWQLSGLELPTSIAANNHNFCIRTLKRGSIEQARNALSVYNQMQDQGLVRNPPLLLKKLAQLAIKGDLALPQATLLPTVTKAFIPLVPNALDDRLTEYARKHGFPDAPNVAGFGYMEYRSLLRKQREARLVEMEKQALEEVIPVKELNDT